MTFKGLLVIKAIVCLVFGIQLLAAPGFLFGILGASLGPAGTFTAREYSAAMLGTLMLCWFAMNAGHAETKQPILLHLFVYDAIGFVVTVSVVLAGTLNVLGWAIAVVYLFFTLGSGYLLLQKEEVAS
jgi:hypothetical protein